MEIEKSFKKTRSELIKDISELTEKKIILPLDSCPRCRNYFSYIELYDIKEWLLNNLDMKKVVVNKL